MKKRIFIDMDDTMCDFSGASKAALEKEPGIQWPQSQFDFFRNLNPITGSVETFKKLEKFYEVHILSRPSADNLMCFTEKAVWVREHLGQEVLSEQRFHLSGRKDYFAELGDAILIDDFDWPGFKGKQIKFGTDEFPDWESVWAYLSPGYGEIESIICPYYDSGVSICFEARNSKTGEWFGNVYIDDKGTLGEHSDLKNWEDLKGMTLDSFLYACDNGECEADVTFKNGDKISDSEEAFYRVFKSKL